MLCYGLLTGSVLVTTPYLTLLLDQGALKTIASSLQCIGRLFWPIVSLSDFCPIVLTLPNGQRTFSSKVTDRIHTHTIWATKVVVNNNTRSLEFFCVGVQNIQYNAFSQSDFVSVTPRDERYRPKPSWSSPYCVNTKQQQTASNRKLNANGTNQKQ